MSLADLKKEKEYDLCLTVVRNLKELKQKACRETADYV